MLRAAKDLRRFKLIGRDGSCGRIHDFYFDDLRWTVRYLVVDTGRWLSGRRVLLPAHMLGPVSLLDETISVDLTQEELGALPGVDTELPVSRQQVLSILGEMTEHLPPGLSQTSLGTFFPSGQVGEEGIKGDPHLQSMREVLGYAVQPEDGVSGQIDDLIFDLDRWTVAFLVVDLHARGLNKRAAIDPSCVLRISWLSVDVAVAMSEAAIAESPDILEVVPRRVESYHLGCAEAAHQVEAEISGTRTLGERPERAR